MPSQRSFETIVGWSIQRTSSVRCVIINTCVGSGAKAAKRALLRRTSQFCRGMFQAHPVYGSTWKSSQPVCNHIGVQLCFEHSKASCLVMTVVILGKCICNFEHGQHCAFNVVHIGKDRALGPDGEKYIRKHSSKSSPFMCVRDNGVLVKRAARPHSARYPCHSHDHCLSSLS